MHLAVQRERNHSRGILEKKSLGFLGEFTVNGGINGSDRSVIIGSTGLYESLRSLLDPRFPVLFRYSFFFVKNLTDLLGQGEIY